MTGATGFNEMLKNAAAFNQPIGWECRLGATQQIFYGATVFSQLLTNWQVTTLSVCGVDAMFDNVVALTRTHVSASNTFSCACSANNYMSDGTACLAAAGTCSYLTGLREDADRSGERRFQLPQHARCTQWRSYRKLGRITCEYQPLFSGFTSFGINISACRCAQARLQQNVQELRGFQSALGSWDVSQSTTFRQMFQGCTNDQPLES